MIPTMKVGVHFVNHQKESNLMWGFVVLLAVWMTYVETEMPNRVYECEFDHSCEILEDSE